MKKVNIRSSFWLFGILILFSGFFFVGTSSVFAVEHLRPDSDISSSGTWANASGGSASYTEIDELPASDSDYIWEDNAAKDEYYEVGLSDPAGSPGSGDHILKWRMMRPSGSKSTSIEAQLRQGTTVIANKKYSVPTTYTEYTYTLNSGEKNSITDYTDLRIRFLITKNPTGGGSAALTDPEISWAELVVPDADGTLSVDIVDASEISVSSPSVSFSSLGFSWAAQQSTAVLGTASEMMRIDNATATATWDLTIAATDGVTALWDEGSFTYDFNGTAAAGRLEMDASVGSIDPAPSCSNTGLSLGSATYFIQGTTDSVTLLSADATADTGCTWDLTDIDLTQDIPAGQAGGTYTLDMTLTAS